MMKNIAKIDFTLFFKNILFAIVLMFLTLSIVTTIVVFIQANDQYIQFDYVGFSNFFDLFKPFSSIYTLMLVTLSSYVAIESLSNRKIVEEGKAILELKKLFNDSELREVNHNLRPIVGKWNNDNLPEVNALRDHWNQIDAYIELFELANKLIDKKVISIESFKQHFGYWFECLIDNNNIRFKVRVEERDWNSFKELCKKMNIDLKSYSPKYDLKTIN